MGCCFCHCGTTQKPSATVRGFSIYDTLLVEVRGDSGSTVEVGVKDVTQSDDGTEAKVILPLFENWRTYAIPVTQFNRAALGSLFVVAEFVFSGPQSQNAWCRTIRYTIDRAPFVSSLVNAASFQEGVGRGSWISVTGQTLSPVARGWTAADFKNNDLPRVLEGVGVDVSGRPIPLSYISPTQINSLVLGDELAEESYVGVTNAVGTSIPIRVIVQRLFPACFALPAQGEMYVAAVHGDGVIVGKAALLGAAVQSRPAKPGEVVQVYCTGLGSDLDKIDARIGAASVSVTFAGMVQPRPLPVEHHRT